MNISLTRRDRRIFDIPLERAKKLNINAIKCRFCQNVFLALWHYSHRYRNHTSTLRISNKYGSITALKQWPKQITVSWRQGASSLAHHWSDFFLDIRHQFQTSILLWDWILTNQQTSICNLGSDGYCEYTSCFFKVVTFFIRNLFRVRFPYLLLIPSIYPYDICSRTVRQCS
jgi:hypothetical protein